MIITCNCGQKLKIKNPPKKKIKVECPVCSYSNKIDKSEEIKSNPKWESNDKNIHHFEDGSFKICDYLEDKPHGLCREYYPNKKIKSKGLFKHGAKDGKWVYYYENGDKKREESYDTPDGYVKKSTGEPVIGEDIWTIGSEGQKHGKWIYYDERGDCTSIENYKEGFQHGITTIYSNEKGPIRYIYRNGIFICKDNKMLSFLRSLKDM